MNTHFLLVHEDGDDTAVTSHEDRKSARAAFKDIDSGLVTLYELRRSQAIKRANFDLTHDESKTSLTKKTDAQLRSEARKRNLTVADNNLATRDQIINEIQQHELSQRLNHRRPLAAGGGSAAPSGDANKSGVAGTNVDGFDDMTVEELKDFDEDVDLTGAKTKQDHIDRHRAYADLDQKTVPELKELAASEDVEISSDAHKATIINAILTARRK